MTEGNEKASTMADTKVRFEPRMGRQNGVAGFEQYLEVKSVAWPIG